ncbi:MAG: hypothetical protein LBU58_01245 [Clostridiales bacterium]|nr:hypothetical protein [Clostridiales bacterium]
MADGSRFDAPTAGLRADRSTGGPREPRRQPARRQAQKPPPQSLAQTRQQPQSQLQKQQPPQPQRIRSAQPPQSPQSPQRQSQQPLQQQRRQTQQLPQSLPQQRQTQQLPTPPQSQRQTQQLPQPPQQQMQLQRQTQSLPPAQQQSPPTATPQTAPQKLRLRSRNSRIALIFAVFLLLYIPSTFNWFSDKNLATDILREGTLSETINTEALVIRDEVLLYPASDGISIPAVNEGDRVAGNARVATVYNEMSIELLNRLKQTNRQLLKSQYEALGQGAVFSQEVETIELDIGGAIRKMIPELNRNSLYTASQRAKEINGLVLKRAEAYSAQETDDPGVNLLKEEKQTIEEQVSQVSGDVLADAPGHVSFMLDGRESELLPGGIEGVTISRFEAILREDSQKKLNLTEYVNGGIAVNAGVPFAKIVKNNDFYLLIRVQGGYLEHLAVGDRVRLRIDGPYREFDDAEVVYRSGGAEAGSAPDGAEIGSDPGGAEDLVALRLSKYLFDFLNARTVNVAVIEKYQEGLKIPIKCLKDYDEQTQSASVVLLKAGNASLRKVRVLAANDVYAIIESADETSSEGRVSRYDTYVRDTTNIEDGMALMK